MALHMSRERLDRLVPRHLRQHEGGVSGIARSLVRKPLKTVGPGICAFAPTCPRDLLDTVEDAILALRARLMSRLSCL